MSTPHPELPEAAYTREQQTRLRALYDALDIMDRCLASSTTLAAVLMLTRFILDGKDEE